MKSKTRTTNFYALLVACALSFVSGAQTVIYSENFESESDTYPLHAPTTGSSSWTATYISGGTSSRWAIYQPSGTTSQLLEMYVGGTDLRYDINQACNTVAYDTDQVDASCYGSLTISFDWAAGGESSNTDDHLIPCYSLNGGSTWFDLGSPLHNSIGYPNLINVSNLDISVLDGQTFNIGFRWLNDASSGTNDGPLIDNIVIRGYPPSCSSTPPEGIVTITSYTTGCSGKNTEVTLSSNIILPAPCSPSPRYQWQSSPNGSTGWVDLPGQTNPVLATDITTTTKYYRLQSSCTGVGGTTSYSNVVSYTAVPCTDYLIDAHTSVTTCLGMFYDTGGSGSNYGDSESETITFCSGSSDHVMVDFFTFETENDGDFGVDETRYDILTVYDGNTTSAPKMFELSGGSDPDEGPVPLIISSGSCLTFQFTSDGGVTDIGWEAMVSCTSEPNNVASNFCETAPFICNLNGYKGTTSNFYNPESVGGQIGSAPSSFPGTLDNNSFIIFQPTATSVSLDLNVFNCSGGITSTSGFYEAIQFAVYEEGAGGSCDIGNWISDYDDVWDGVTPGNYTKNLTGLTIGDTYYIMVDGLWGTVCDYSIDVISGIALPTLDVDAATICSGNSVTITATGGTGYLWSTGSTSPSITVSSQDVYSVEVSSGNPSCPDNTMLFSNITVDACLPVTLTDLSGDCATSTSGRLIRWTTASEQNSSHFVVESSIDGVTWTAVETVAAAGNSNQENHYESLDRTAYAGIVYYRLAQVDNDGQTQVYGPIAVSCDEADQFVLYPNPATNQLNILIPAKYTTEDFVVQLFNPEGRIILSESLNNSFSNKIEMDISAVAKGVYFIQGMTNDGVVYTDKLVKE